MVGIVLYWVILFVWTAIVTYFIVFDLVPMLTGKWHPKHGHHLPDGEEAPEAPPGYSVYEGFRSFADKDGKLTTEDIVKGLAREEKDI